MLQSEWISNYLPAIVLFAGVLLAGWLYLRGRVGAESSPNHKAGSGQSRVATDSRIQPKPETGASQSHGGQEGSGNKAFDLMRRDFVSNASHELRTPISVIYGYLEMMMQEDIKGIGKEWKTAIRQMHEQTERIKKIIEDMLLLSRLEETDSVGNHDYSRMAPILDSAFNNAKVLGAHKNHRIEVDCDPNSALLCSKESITSLISNLVSNAIRYTPDNGSIIIRWEISDEGGALSVMDTGIGIVEKEISRITERFYRVDPARSRETGGTGLGLAIVNHIVNHHQATLHIKSELGQGSLFVVKFPPKRVRRYPSQTELLLN